MVTWGSPILGNPHIHIDRRLFVEGFKHLSQGYHFYRRVIFHIYIYIVYVILYRKNTRGTRSTRDPPPRPPPFADLPFLSRQIPLAAVLNRSSQTEKSP